MNGEDEVIARMEQQNERDRELEARRQRWIRNLLVGLVTMAILALGVALTSSILSIRFGDAKSDQLDSKSRQLDQAQEQLARFTEQSTCRSDLATAQSVAESVASAAGREYDRAVGGLVEVLALPNDDPSKAQKVKDALARIGAAVQASDAADKAAAQATRARQTQSPDC